MFGVIHEIFLLEPHISVHSSRLTLEQKVTIQMHQAVPKTKSHVRSPLYRGSYRHDSGVRDSRHPKGARSMPSKNKELEEDPAGNAPPEFIAERDHFLEWVYNNQELKKHIVRRAIKRGYSQELVEEGRSRMYEYCLTGYGKDNQFQRLWQDIENPQKSSRKDPEIHLLTYLKSTFNSKLIDAIKPLTFLPPEEEKFPVRDQIHTSHEEPTSDSSKIDGVTHDDEPEFVLNGSGMANRIRNCIRKHNRTRHRETWIKIINLWENGYKKEPRFICASIPGLTPSSYNDLQGALIDFLKKHRDDWFNDEDGEDQS